MAGQASKARIIGSDAPSLEAIAFANLPATEKRQPGEATKQVICPIHECAHAKVCILANQGNECMMEDTSSEAWREGRDNYLAQPEVQTAKEHVKHLAGLADYHTVVDWGQSEPAVAIVAQGSPQEIEAYHERERLERAVIEAAKASRRAYLDCIAARRRASDTEWLITPMDADMAFDACMRAEEKTVDALIAFDKAVKEPK